MVGGDGMALMLAQRRRARHGVEPASTPDQDRCAAHRVGRRSVGIHKILTGSAVLAALATAVPARAQQDVPPDVKPIADPTPIASYGGHLVFSRADGKGCDVYKVDLGGGHESRYTAANATDASEFWPTY